MRVVADRGSARSGHSPLLRHRGSLAVRDQQDEGRGDAQPLEDPHEQRSQGGHHFADLPLRRSKGDQPVPAKDLDIHRQDDEVIHKNDSGGDISQRLDSQTHVQEQEHHDHKIEQQPRPEHGVRELIKEVLKALSAVGDKTVDDENEFDGKDQPRGDSPVGGQHGALRVRRSRVGRRRREYAGGRSRPRRSWRNRRLERLGHTRGGGQRAAGVSHGVPSTSLTSPRCGRFAP